MWDLQHALETAATREKTNQEQIAAMTLELQKVEESKAKDEEREGKLKSLLTKSKKSLTDTRQQLDSKEEECQKLQQQVRLVSFFICSD